MSRVHWWLLPCLALLGCRQVLGIEEVVVVREDAAATDAGRGAADAGKDGAAPEVDAADPDAGPRDVGVPSLDACGRDSLPTLGDWDGDGVATPGLFDPFSQRWCLTDAIGGRAITDERSFGEMGHPVAGDFDGDGRDQPGIYFPDTESPPGVVWSLDGHRLFGWGNQNNEFTVGRWREDKDDTPGEYVPGSGAVHLNQAVSGGIQWKSGTWLAGADRVLAGDWDGDGLDGLALYHTDEGRWRFAELTLSPGDVERGLEVSEIESFVWAPDPAGVPLVGDWNPEEPGDEVGMYRLGGWWLLERRDPEAPVREFVWGLVR